MEFDMKFITKIMEMIGFERSVYNDNMNNILSASNMTVEEVTELCKHKEKLNAELRNCDRRLDDVVQWWILDSLGNLYLSLKDIDSRKPEWMPFWQLNRALECLIENDWVDCYESPIRKTATYRVSRLGYTRLIRKYKDRGAEK